MFQYLSSLGRLLQSRLYAPIARLVPEASDSEAENARAVGDLRALRQSIAQRGEAFSHEALKTFRDTGRR
ncbi:MAG: hypothetical protein AAGC69_11865 [Paracraurococcus sp.]